MRQTLKKTLQTLFSVAILLGVAWLLYFAVYGVADYIRSLNSELAKALVAAAAAIIASAVTVTIGKAYEASAATTRELRQKKAPIYETIVQEFFKVFFADMLGASTPAEADLKKFFARTTETLAIWGSDGVVNAFGKFKKGSTEPQQMMFMFEDLLFEIRKDLGHGKNLPRAALLRLFITDIDETLAARTTPRNAKLPN